MNVLWIVNTVFPEVAEEIGVSRTNTVGWIHSSAMAFLDNITNVKFATATIYEGGSFRQIDKNGITHFLIPSRRKLFNNKFDYSIFWHKIERTFKPDIVHIHGTEYPQILSYIEVYGADKVIVSIQGLVNVIERYYFGDISKISLIKSITIRDLIRLDTVFSQKSGMKKRGKVEKDIIRSVKNVIGRTSWDKAHLFAINPKINYLFCNETLRNSFYENKWSLKNCVKHSIFISQSHYPIKGIHKLILAIPFVLREFPDTRIFVAGHNYFENRGMRINGFGKFVNSLIDKYNLRSHIIFTGLLSEQEMIDKYLKSHVYISPSIIENSPNSVGEAQLLGVPCISTYVGGTPDMIIHKENGLLYRFAEIEMLAASICEIFSNSSLAEKLSVNGTKTAKIRHDRVCNAKNLFSIYEKIIEGD